MNAEETKDGGAQDLGPEFVNTKASDPVTVSVSGTSDEGAIVTEPVPPIAETNADAPESVPAPDFTVENGKQLPHVDFPPHLNGDHGPSGEARARLEFAKRNPGPVVG